MLPWGRLLVVALLAGVAGIALGIGLGKLSRGGGPAPGDAVAATPASPAQVSVTVLSGVLHPAATAAGRLRQRARLVVDVRIRNRGSQEVTIARPTLLVAGTSRETDPNEDAPGTTVGLLGPGRQEDVALQFEVAGTATASLTGSRRARVFVAGRTLTTRVTIGAPVGPGSASPAP
jgi:hypothetical protein